MVQWEYLSTETAAFKNPSTWLSCYQFSYFQRIFIQNVIILYEILYYIVSLFPCNSETASGHTYFQVGILSLQNDGRGNKYTFWWNFTVVQFKHLGPMDLIDKSYLFWTQGSVMDPRNFQIILDLYVFFCFKFLINVNKISNMQVLSEINETDKSPSFISIELISVYKCL